MVTRAAIALSMGIACRSEPPAFDAREIDLGGQADPLWFEPDDVLMAYVRPTGEAMRVDLTTGDLEVMYPGGISIDAIGETGDYLIATNEDNVIRLGADGSVSPLFVMDPPNVTLTSEVLVSADGNVVVWNDSPWNNLHVHDVALGITQNLVKGDGVERDGLPWAMDEAGSEFVVADVDHLDEWSIVSTADGAVVEVDTPVDPYDVVATGDSFRFASNYGFDDVGPDVVIASSEGDVLLETEPEEGGVWFEFGGFTPDGESLLLLEERRRCGPCKAGWLALVRYDVGETRGHVLGAGSEVPQFDGVTYYSNHPVAVDTDGERIAIPSPRGLWLIGSM